MALARRAVSLDPSQVYHRLALARVLWSAAKRDEAQQAARGALTLAKSDGDRAAVRELIDFFDKNAGSPADR